MIASGKLSRKFWTSNLGQNKKPLSRNFVLKTVWNYSSKTDTHTVETHIHRLRKKILDKFDDKNFIKNDNRGYYI